MDERDFRPILWLVDAVFWSLAILMRLGFQALDGVLLTYENQGALSSARLWFGLGLLVVVLVSSCLTIALLIWSWYIHKTRLKQWLSRVLSRIAQTALGLAAKLSPKPPATVQQQQKPRPPAAPPKPDPTPPPPPPPSDPPPPDLPEPPPPPLWPPWPTEPDPTPPPSDSTSSPTKRPPDNDPNSGGAALPIPQEPIRKMANAVLAVA